MTHYFGIAGHQFSVSGFALFIVALAVWSLVWKGIALWFAARNYQKGWFIAIVILNSAGILEIIYLVFFRRDKKQGVTKSLFDKALPGSDGDLVAQKPGA